MEKEQFITRKLVDLCFVDVCLHYLIATFILYYLRGKDHRDFLILRRTARYTALRK